jgi:hypothetical protein
LRCQPPSRRRRRPTARRDARGEAALLGGRRAQRDLADRRVEHAGADHRDEQAGQEQSPRRVDRHDRQQRLAGADQRQAAAEDLPRRRKYLLLVTGFMRRLFQLHLDLVDEVERELDGPAA